MGRESKGNGHVLPVYLSLKLTFSEVKPPRFPAGPRHGGDPVSAGVRLVRAAAGGGEAERLLRVHQAAHRPLQHHGLWQV